MQELEFFHATIDELPEIVAIYNSTISSRMVTADLEPVSVESRLAWFHEHDPMRRPLWAVKDKDQQIVGWASFQSFYGRPAYNGTVEVSVYLHAQQRGKGIGKQVLAFCIAQAPRYGIKTLLGYIFAHNEPSLKLFAQQGFEVWARLPNIAELDGIERTLLILGKRVA